MSPQRSPLSTTVSTSSRDCSSAGHSYNAANCSGVMMVRGWPALAALQGAEERRITDTPVRPRPLALNPTVISRQDPVNSLSTGLLDILWHAPMASSLE
jgi:hypothetical protein